jgi:hypothetical protein
MAILKAKANSQNTKSDTKETSLAKRILNSNLSDDDKITLIRLVGNPSNTAFIPTIREDNPPSLSPMYKKLEFTTTCPVEKDACHRNHASRE